MIYILYAIFFLSCLALVAAVLLQPGKTDAGALFTSNVSSSALAPRGTATVLSKITITAAIVFMISALMLSMPALTGNVSILSSTPDTPIESTAPTSDEPAANVAAEQPADASSAPAGNASAAPAASPVGNDANANAQPNP